MYTLILISLCLIVWPQGTAWSSALKPPERSYKILILIPVSPPSHRNVFIPLAESLADRGHQVEILSYLPPFTTTRNITQYTTGQEPDIDINMFEIREEPFKEMSFFEKLLIPAARELYTIQIVKDLYSRRKAYDLFIVDHMVNEMAYPFAHEMPFITVATPGVDHMQSAMYGNILNPSYVVTALMTVEPPLTLFKRAVNLAVHIAQSVIYNYLIVIPSIQREISKHFPDLPPLLEIQRNQSLTLMNSYFSGEVVVPLLPAQVEVGGMHCRPGEPLPNDIDEWLSETSDVGAIYFSLGSITQGTTMPTHFRDVFVEAFNRIQQKVIWKYEGEIPGLSENVMLRKWLPQQDVLSDPRVKLFISHGGLLGTQEAMYHAKPILVLPIYGDQPRNALNIVNNGIGLSLNWDDLTPQLLIDTITTLIRTPSYTKNAEEVSRLQRDRIQSPKDTAVFWTEYVIRHNGAPQLRSPAADLSWIQFLLLDILCIVVITMIIIYCFIKRIMKVIHQRIFRSEVIKRKSE